MPSSVSCSVAVCTQASSSAVLASKTKLGETSRNSRKTAMASVTESASGSTTTSPPPGPRRIAATDWCSSTLTAWRSTGRPTP